MHELLLKRMLSTNIGILTKNMLLKVHIIYIIQVNQQKYYKVSTRPPKGLHTLQKFLELVSGTPIQSNWVICSRNKRSKEVSGTCVQCMQALSSGFVVAWPGEQLVKESLILEHKCTLFTSLQVNTSTTYRLLQGCHNVVT